MRGAIESAQQRNEMARRVNYNHKKTKTQELALKSGDRVVCKNTQYVSKTGKAKFQNKNEAVREYPGRKTGSGKSIGNGFVCSGV